MHGLPDNSTGNNVLGKRAPGKPIVWYFATTAATNISVHMHRHSFELQQMLQKSPFSTADRFCK